MDEQNQSGSSEVIQYIKEIMGNMMKIDYVKPRDIPNIDLYMDQVTTFMDQHLESSKRYEDDKLLTKTMINNYTKNNLLPSPDKKKYSKDHMYLLIFIYYMKTILSIRDIQRILEPLTGMFFKTESGVSLEQIYEEVFRFEQANAKVIMKDMIHKMKESKDTFLFVEDEKEKDFLQTFALVCMLCFDVFTKKQMIEKLIDSNAQFEKKGENEDA